MNNFLNNIKYEFKQGTILNKLIYINGGVFLLASMLNVLSFLFQYNFNPLLNKFYLPSNINILIRQPWSFVSYMFLHNDFLHFLFNMIYLHFGGKLFLKHLNQKQLLGTYILGGLIGGLLFIIAYNYAPVLLPFTDKTLALGASASALAIVIAIATYIPNYNIQLPFIGSLKLKHVAIAIIILEILSLPKGNTGGHIAHIGGAIFGYLYIKQLKRRNDLSSSFINFIYKFINSFKIKNTKKNQKRRAKSDHEFNSEKAKKQKEIDKILEKIAKSGYESLNKEEKKNLFSASKK